MTTVINTERLTLRPFTPEDAAAYFAVRSDPQVARFLAGNTPQSVEDMAGRIDVLTQHWADHGYGLWAVIEKSSGALIGHSGLWKLTNHPDTEIAYAFAPAYWGKGYATESARAAVDYGFNQAKLQRLIAVAFPENTASINVMKKLGMTFEGIVDRYFNATLACYWIENPNV